MSTHYDAELTAALIMARILGNPRNSEPDIRPIGEFEAVPECRILYRDGKPAADVLVDRPVLRLPLNVVITPTASSYVPPAERIKGRRSEGRVKRAAKPRTPKAERCDKIKLNAEELLTLRGSGLTVSQIARKMDCSDQTIHKTLSAARKNPDWSTREAALCVCECGRSKRAGDGSKCKVCKQKTGGKQGGANKITALTVRVIIDGWKSGKATPQIAREWGCDRKTADSRIKAATPEEQAEIAILRTCQCGRAKLAANSMCARCKKPSGADYTKLARAKGVQLPMRRLKLGFASLTAKQLLVVRGVAAGLRGNGLAASVGMKPNTVKNYTGRCILPKLGLANRNELRQWCEVNSGLLSGIPRPDAGTGIGSIEGDEVTV